MNVPGKEEESRVVGCAEPRCFSGRLVVVFDGSDLDWRDIYLMVLYGTVVMV